MPIDLFWDSAAQNIIRQEFKGRWTADEYVKNVFTMYDMMETVSHRVHIIVDMTHMEGTTTRLIAAAPRFHERLPVNRGLTVGINIPSYVVSIVHVATRIYPRLGRHVHFTSNLADAYTVIEKYGLWLSQSPG